MLFVLSTLALAVAPWLTQDPGAEPDPEQDGNEATLDPVQELVGAYRAAQLGWERERRSARRAKLAFDEPHPVLRFEPRFRALADEGEGRALLWLATECDELDLDVSALRERKRADFEALLECCAHEPWMQEVAQLVARERRWLGEEGVRGVLERIYEENKVAGAVLAAGTALARRLERDEDGEQRAHAIYRSLIERFPGRREARELDDMLFVKENLVVGKLAPELEGETVDGAAVKLSDFRGKIVVLDFWGFW